MNRRLSFLLVLILSAGFASAALADIEWKNDLAKALADAKEQKKPVFAFFFHYLYYQNPNRQREDFLVWESPIVQKYIPSFIPVKVNVEGKGDIDRQYGVRSYPTVLFFDPDGRELLSLRVEDKEMKRTILSLRMKQALAAIEEFSLVEQQIKKDNSNPSLVLKYADGLRDRGQFDLAEEQFYRLLQWNNLDANILQQVKSDYTNMQFLRAAQAFYESNFDQCIDVMQRFIDKNPKNEAIPQARMLIGMSMYESGNEKEGEKILKELSRDKNAGPVQAEAKNYLNEKEGGTRR